MSPYTTPEEAVFAHNDVPIKLTMEWVVLQKVEAFSRQPLGITAERLHYISPSQITWELAFEYTLPTAPTVVNVRVSRTWTAPCDRNGNLGEDVDFTEGKAVAAMYLGDDRKRPLGGLKGFFPLNAIKRPMSEWLDDYSREWLLKKATALIAARAEEERRSADRLRAQADFAANKAAALDSTADSAKQIHGRMRLVRLNRNKEA